MSFFPPPGLSTSWPTLQLLPFVRSFALQLYINQTFFHIARLESHLSHSLPVCCVDRIGLSTVAINSIHNVLSLLESVHSTWLFLHEDVCPLCLRCFPVWVPSDCIPPLPYSGPGSPRQSFWYQRRLPDCSVCTIVRAPIILDRANT